jgi:hypothetical protein
MVQHSLKRLPRNGFNLRRAGEGGASGGENRRQKEA